MPAYKYGELQPAKTTIRLATFLPACYGKMLLSSQSIMKYSFATQSLSFPTKLSLTHGVSPGNRVSLVFGPLRPLWPQQKTIFKKRVLLICPRIANVEEPGRDEIGISGFSSNSAEDKITLEHSQNLAGAPKDLRYKKKPRRLWIEAICTTHTVTISDGEGTKTPTILSLSFPNGNAHSRPQDVTYREWTYGDGTG